MELMEECIGDLDLYEETDLPEETEGFVAGGSSDPSFKEVRLFFVFRFFFQVFEWIFLA